MLSIRFLLSQVRRTSQRARIHMFTPPNMCVFVFCVSFVLLSVMALSTLLTALQSTSIIYVSWFCDHRAVCLHLRGRIGTDTGCAGCRRVERTVQCEEHTPILFSQVRHTYVTKGTYAFIYSHVFYRWLYIPYILVHIYGALVYSAWYQVVAACNSSSGWNLSLVIRVHITTKLHELKTSLDARKD